MEVTLPKIRVSEAQNGDSNAGIAGVESPTTVTDGGQPARPHSTTSTESMWFFFITPA